MKAWLCACGCEVKEKKPVECPLCKKPDRFTETELPDPPPEDKKYSKLYKDSLNQLVEYEKGCPPKKLDPCCEDC